MGWYGPNGDCSCKNQLVCPCADSSEHELTDLFYDAPVTNTCGVFTYIRATVSGLQSSVDFSFARFLAPYVDVDDYEISGMDALNGFHDYLIDGSCISTSTGTYGADFVMTDVPGRRFDIGSFTVDGLFRTVFQESDCADLGTSSIASIGSRVTDQASRVIFSRSALNDIQITYELTGAPPSGDPYNTLRPANMFATATIKCSENFSSVTVPINFDFFSYTMPACSPARVVNSPFQIGTLKLELIRK